MDNSTFRSRLANLMQKSRKALRLYTSMERSSSRPSGSFEASDLADLQVAEWRSVNSDLLRALTEIVTIAQNRRMINELCALKERFYAEWQALEHELQERQEILISASNQGDFLKAAGVTRSLVAAKARLQASNAAFQELEDLVGPGRSVAVVQGMGEENDHPEPSRRAPVITPIVSGQIARVLSDAPRQKAVVRGGAIGRGGAIVRGVDDQDSPPVLHLDGSAAIEGGERSMAGGEIHPRDFKVMAERRSSGEVGSSSFGKVIPLRQRKTS